MKANSPVPEALGPQGQEGRAHVAVVELGPPGAARAVPRRRTRAGQGLQAPVLRQARPVGARRQLRRLRRGGGRLRRLPAHGDARPGQGGRFPHHLPQPELPDVVVRVRARPRAASSSTRCSAASTTTASRRRWQKAFDGADRFFPINYQKDWEVVREVAKGSGQGFDKAAVRQGDQARGRGRGRRRQAKSDAARHRCSRCARAPVEIVRRRQAGAERHHARDRARAASPRSSAPSGTGKSHADPLHQPAGRADRRRDPVRRARSRQAVRRGAARRRAARSAWCSRSTTWSSA